MTIVPVKYPEPGPMTLRAETDIVDVIVHHTAGPKDQTPLEIDAEHRAINDAMIAYHFVIAQDGTIYAGRPTQYVPAAAFGRNAQSIDVVLVGQFQKDAPGYTGAPTAAQMESLEALALYLYRRFPGIVRTIGHRDVATMFYPTNTEPYATQCPGDDCYELLPALVKRVAAALVSGK